MMINKIAIIAAAGLLTMSVASAQNTPPPGNVNPGSMNSGAEQTGAPNQARSYGPYYNAPRGYYGQGYDSYAAQPGMSYGPFGYSPGYGPYGLGTGGAGAIGSNN
jgi:hypothetical protein